MKIRKNREMTLIYVSFILMWLIISIPFIIAIKDTSLKFILLLFGLLATIADAFIFFEYLSFIIEEDKNK